MFKKTYAKIVGVSSAVVSFVGAPLAVLATGATNVITLPSESKYGFKNLGEAITNVMNLVFFFALILVLVYLIWGGIQWITSGGDKAGTEAARGKITGAIVGIIIVSVAFAIFQLMLTFVGASNSFEIRSPSGTTP